MITVWNNSFEMQRRNGLVKKLFVNIVLAISIIMLATILTGCSLASYKPSVDKVEQVAQECINPNITSASKRIEKVKSNAGVYYIYPMVDDRGIAFDVKLHDDYVSIVEPIPPFFSNYRVFYNNYPHKIIEFYENDITAMLNIDSVEKYNFNSGVEISFKPGTNYEEIAQIIMDIDSMLAIDYRCGGIAQTRPECDTKTFWDGFSTACIRVIIKEEIEGKRKTTLFKVYDFSGQNGTKLTYDEVLEGLNSYEAK